MALTETQIAESYYGFCNQTLWPIFHSMPSYGVIEQRYWSRYWEVNEVFSDAVMEEIRPDGLIWIHDYHLMLLPQLLRNKGIQHRIGFFLHIPFPPAELFQLFPTEWAESILEGVLGSTLIGFQTSSFPACFLQAASIVGGYSERDKEIAAGGRAVKIGVFPIGIDFERFHRASSNPASVGPRSELRAEVPDLKRLLFVGRLDYTKGAINCLAGYERWLESDPGSEGKAVLSLLLVPSRMSLLVSQRTKAEIDGLVQRINWRFGSAHWTPVTHQLASLPFDALVALYDASDVMLVTSLCDGMNLVAQEYVASRTAGLGVIVLSEMAGAAQELRGVVGVDPREPDQIAKAIGTAIQMPAEEQTRRIRAMQKHLQEHSASRWGNEFLACLITSGEM